MGKRPNTPSAQEKLIIDAVLDFASLSPVNSAAEVYELFDQFGISGRVARLIEIGIEAASIFESDRRRLVAMLRVIEASVGDARQQLRAEVNRLVIEKKAFTVPSVATGGELRWQLYGVEAAIYLAIALLLDPTRPFGARLHHCGREGCPKWFVTRHGRGGRPNKPRYCDRKHQREQDDINACGRMEERRKRKRGRKATQARKGEAR